MLRFINSIFGNVRLSRWGPNQATLQWWLLQCSFSHFLKKFQNLYESNMKIIKLIDHAVILSMDDQERIWGDNNTSTGRLSVRGTGLGARGFLVWITLTDQKRKKHQGKVPGHFWSTAKVPLSKSLYPECLECLSKATYLFSHPSITDCTCFFFPSVFFKLSAKTIVSPLK